MIDGTLQCRNWLWDKGAAKFPKKGTGLSLADSYVQR